jgi:hypothetical protein
MRAALAHKAQPAQARQAPAVSASTLEVGRPGDRFEREADRAADEVVAERRPTWSLSSMGVDAPARTGLTPPGRGGRPIEAAERSFMEQRFGRDFSGVRIHDDEAAARSARDVAANAYTVGNDIVFGRERPAPTSTEGRRLLAHELAHVVQQTGGPQGGAGPVVVEQRSGPRLARQESGEGAQTYTVTLRYPPSRVEKIGPVSKPEAIKRIGWFVSQVEAHIAGGKEGRDYLQKLHDDNWTIATVSNVLGGFKKLPPKEIWSPADGEVAAARAALAQGDFDAGVRHAQAAAEQARKAETAIYEYREGTISGASRAVFGLEVVVAASAAVVAVGAAGVAAGAGGAAALTGLATGATATGTAGTVGLVTGGVYGGVQNLAGQAAAVHGGTQKEIDWAGIGFDTAFGMIAGRLGGKAGGYFVRRLEAQFGKRIAIAVLGDLLAGRLGSTLHSAARTVFDSARGLRQLTLDAFTHETIDRLLDPRGAFIDLIMGAAMRRLSGSAPAKPGPPPSSPGPQHQVEPTSTQPAAPPQASAGPQSTTLAPQSAVEPTQPLASAPEARNAPAPAAARPAVTPESAAVETPSTPAGAAPAAAPQTAEPAQHAAAPSPPANASKAAGEPSLQEPTQPATETPAPPAAETVPDNASAPAPSATQERQVVPKEGAGNAASVQGGHDARESSGRGAAEVHEKLAPELAAAEADLQSARRATLAYQTERTQAGRSLKGGPSKSLWNAKERIWIIKRQMAYPDRTILEQVKIVGVKTPQGTEISAHSIAKKGRTPDYAEIRGSKVIAGDLKSSNEFLKSIKGGVSNPKAIEGEFRGTSKIAEQHKVESKIRAAAKKHGGAIILEGVNVLTGNVDRIEVPVDQYSSEVLTYEDVRPN